ncbi:MAG: hypothetical protein QM589_14705 [Thermomicrobiales bacterium]
MSDNIDDCPSRRPHKEATNTPRFVSRVVDNLHAVTNRRRVKGIDIVDADRNRRDDRCGCIVVDRAQLMRRILWRSVGDDLAEIHHRIKTQEVPIERLSCRRIPRRDIRHNPQHAHGHPLLPNQYRATDQ